MDSRPRGRHLRGHADRADLGASSVPCHQDRKIRRGRATDKAAYLKRLAARCRFCLQHSRGPGAGAVPHARHRGMEATKVWVQVPAIWKARTRVGTDPGVGRAGLGAEPPAGVEEPLEWILLSSLPVQTEAELLLRQAWYRAPPLIEDFHQVEKRAAVRRTCGSRRPRRCCRCWECCRWWRCGCCSCGGGDAARCGGGTAAATTEELAVIRRLGMGPDGTGLRACGGETRGFPGPAQRWGTGVEDPVAGLPATPGHADGHEAGWEDARSRYRYKST